MKRSTVSGLVEILQDLLIAAVLPVFGRRAKKQVIAHGKFCYFSCGVYRSLRPTGPLDRPEEIDGAALETLVYQHLRAWIDHTNREDTFRAITTHQAYRPTDFIPPRPAPAPRPAGAPASTTPRR